MVGVKDDFDDVIEPRKVLIYGIVHDFPDAVVEGRAIVRVAEVHPGAFSNGFKPFKDLNATSIIIIAHDITKLG